MKAMAISVVLVALTAMTAASTLAGEELSATGQFNLGNEHARRGETGRAVLAFERALAIDPHDADARANLEQVRKDAGLYREPPAAWRRPLALLGTNEWAWTGLAALVALAGLVFLRRAFPGRRAVLATLTVLVLVAAAGAVVRADDLDRAVVVADDARLLVSPWEAAESLGPLASGRLVRIRRAYEDYVEVRDETGRTGWVPRADVEEITSTGS
jgi:tetratricopeptide (TPR) repeat protein